MYSRYRKNLSDFYQVLDHACINLENNYLNMDEQRKMYNEMLLVETHLKAIKEKMTFIKRHTEVCF